MAQQANMRFVRNLLYKLKRQYGGKLTLHKIVSTDVNQQTGVRDTVRSEVNVNLAIVLPSSLARKFASQVQPTYGAQWDQSERIVIIDIQDLPKDFTIGIETFATFEGARYVVKSSERLDVGFGYILTLGRTENALPFTDS